MKPILVILFSSFIIIFLGCISAGPGSGDEGTLIYETDFSEDDGMFEYNGGIFCGVEGGVLRLQGASDKAAAAFPVIEYGNDSVTSFRIFFGEPVAAHINFLTIYQQSRLLMHVMPDYVNCRSFINREVIGDAGFVASLLPGRWYDFSVAIVDYLLTLNVDSVPAGSIEIDRRLPPKGYLIFECHGEYRVDDLRIVETTGAAVQGEKTEERLAGVEDESIRNLLYSWEEAIRNRNREALAELMWPDITFEFNDRRGQRTLFLDLESVQRFRLDFFDGLGLPENYRLPKPDRHEYIDESNQAYSFYHGSNVAEWLHFRKRTGQWRISHLEIVMPVPGSWVTNRWQAAADGNSDGFLQPDEQERLFNLTAAFFQGPRRAASPVDSIFDTDGDGAISMGEIGEAVDVFFGYGIRWFSRFQPGWAVNMFDLNGDGKLEDDELEIIHRFMDGAERKEETSGKDRDYFLRSVVRMPFPDAVFQPVPRAVSNYIDALGDRDGNGQIELDEQEIILQALGHYHDAENDLELALDLNQDGKINRSDVLLALQASAAGPGISGGELDPPYVVTTSPDRYLDRNGDGRVDREELEAVLAFLGGGVFSSGSVSQKLRKLIDRNGDGRFEPHELESAAGIILHPHPADPARQEDIAWDVNGDGFIDPEELGITAGFTSRGKIPPLSDRLRVIRMKPAASETDGKTPAARAEGFQSEYYRRLGKIQDRKLAVISMDKKTIHVDEETAEGIIVFVENAFVNVGKVRVVERKNIEEILEEYKFQASGLIDEGTAIEIGKLSGADIIVIGSINRVGGIFYLNIKLIEVKTGEIIGSNIARGKDASEFLDMCNQAVYMLF